LFVQRKLQVIAKKLSKKQKKIQQIIIKKKNIFSRILIKKTTIVKNILYFNKKIFNYLKLQLIVLDKYKIINKNIQKNKVTKD